MTTRQSDINELIILHAIFAKIDKTAFSIASGFIFFLGMFAVTAIVINLGTATEVSIAPYLQSISYYLPGYSLTWMGNLIGSIYLGIIGAIIGLIFAILWNLVHYLYLAVVINRLRYFDDE